MNTLLTPAEVARYLGVTIGTLSVWRCTGRYPLNFIKVGRRVMYRQSDVENFVNGGGTDE
ncbi:helix-turn-helix domain-containing protein [Shewanella basaltis]|uniref:helix-turn-helix domain-containing protein n=1 Tax=Shewanella basaltis TaxID=472183 RepID=UPI00200CC218|nr:helix-turn-helix domain-containing protein [Shewanella basaltis]MCL1112542.1 helix-turn-helix domain-containing protein [Shewanella basaltis]